MALLFQCSMHTARYYYDTPLETRDFVVKYHIFSMDEFYLQLVTENIIFIINP